MAKYSINQEGVNSLNHLAKELLINVNNIVEANQYLEGIVVSLYDNLGVYGDEILAIVSRNSSTLNINRDAIVNIAQKVKKQSEDIEELINGSLSSYNVRDSKRNSIFDKLVSSIFVGEVLKGRYNDKNEIPQKDYDLIEQYVTDGNTMNTLVRNGNETKDIESFRKLIGNHTLTEDMILYRKSSRNDFNDVNLLNCPLDELVGQKIIFSGFMSTTPNKVHAEKSNNSNFEIEFIVSKGLRALDLSNLSYNEVIFNDKIKYIIEDAKLIGQNTEHIVARIVGYDE